MPASNRPPNDPTKVLTLTKADAYRELQYLMLTQTYFAPSGAEFEMHPYLGTVALQEACVNWVMTYGQLVLPEEMLP